jgi:uncharacterized membrane protein
MFRATLVLAAVLWPLTLGAAVATRVRGAEPIWTDVIYVAASRVCHQRPERSFHTAGVQWPVCGRCAGLYLSAPIGALAAWLARRRAPRMRAPFWLAIAALPTALTLGLEWLDLAHVTNVDRALAALPLGAAIAFIVVAVAERELARPGAHKGRPYGMSSV